MSIYTYIFRPDNKSKFELGKSYDWSNDLSVFAVQKTRMLLDGDPYLEESDIKCFNICDYDLLKLCILKHFTEQDFEYDNDDDYIDYVVTGILNFCDNKEVFILMDTFETYYDLKDYVELGTIYRSN